jgi:hypothetical protein
MSAVELALAKQRLQLAASAQRAALASHAAGLQALFLAADRARAGLHWLGRHPEALAAGVAVLAAVRPGVRSFLWRWGRRAVFAWGVWRDRRQWLPTR